MSGCNENTTLVVELKNPRDPSFPPFLDACKECNLTLVQSLVKDRDPSDGSLTFGLRFAFGADRIDIARCLLDHRAIIDVDTVERIKSLAGFQLLLEYSNPPLALAPAALQIAVSLEDESSIRFLLSRGVDPNFGSPNVTAETMGIAMDSVGPPVTNSGTALETAALCNSTPAIIDLLIEHGAKVENSIALHTAVANRRCSIAMMEHLVSLGMDVNALAYPTRIGLHHGTPLHCTSRLGRVNEARWLLEHGANPNKMNRFGFSPALLAVFDKRPAIIQLYKDMGINPHAAPASLRH